MNHPIVSDMLDDAESLRALIGRRVQYLGEEYEISDVLVEDGLLILSSSSRSEMQDDVYGRAHRLVPGHQLLRFRDPDGQPSHVWADLVFLDGNGDAPGS